MNGVRILLFSIAALMMISAVGVKPFPVSAPGVSHDYAARLHGPNKCHTQGVDVADGKLFVSCVERSRRKSLILAYDQPEGFPEKTKELDDPKIIDLTAKGMYHPSGLDHDEKCLWAASAHYRRFLAKSQIICIAPDTLKPEVKFTVDDHIGGVAVTGDALALLNWDTKNIYRYSKQGKLLSKHDSPGGTAYQDCDGVSDNEMLCSGVNGEHGDQAVVDLLAFSKKEGWKIERRTLLSVPGVKLGREGFTILPDGRPSFLPGDYPEAVLYVFPKNSLGP